MEEKQQEKKAAASRKEKRESSEREKRRKREDEAKKDDYSFLRFFAPIILYCAFEQNESDPSQFILKPLHWLQRHHWMKEPKKKLRLRKYFLSKESISLGNWLQLGAKRVQKSGKQQTKTQKPVTTDAKRKKYRCG